MLQRWLPRRLPTTALILTFALVAAACSSGSDEPSAAPVEDFDTLDGGTTSFGDFAGEPLVVNFFQSTCAPCVAEMPEFEAVSQEQAGAVTFIGINTQDTVEAGIELVEKTGVTYTTGRDPSGALWLAMGGLAMPLTTFVDAEGQIVHSHNGALDAKALTELIDQHLKVS